LPECNRIQERVVRLASGVAIIRVGGATEVEMTEKKHRIEDALEAVSSAQQEGIVAGGGVALLRASNGIEEGTNSEHSLAAAIIQQACREPIHQMALNAGDSPDLIIEQVLNAEQSEGWDFRESCLTSMVEQGIIDPVKVTRTALQNAASCAGTLITTNYGIIQTE